MLLCEKYPVNTLCASVFCRDYTQILEAVLVYEHGNEQLNKDRPT